jgi:ATP-dependent exoDNAse (exonuclease V) beta subunit
VESRTTLHKLDPASPGRSFHKLEKAQDKRPRSAWHDATERHLLYVACTRARDHLLVTGVEPASEFLQDLEP